MSTRPHQRSADPRDDNQRAADSHAAGRGAVKDRALQLNELGRYFADRSMFAEAAELFALALHVDPADAEARRSLEGARGALRRARGRNGATLREAVRDELGRDSIDAAHYLGLAQLYFQKRRFSSALECLETAQAKNPEMPGPHKLHGAILFRRKDFEGAAQELAKALRLDPFDREVAEMLGLAEHERRRFAQAADATAYAFLLLPDLESEPANRLRRRLLTLKRILGWNGQELQDAFRRQRERLETAFDRLAWRRGHLLAEEHLPRGVFFGAPPPRLRRGLIDLAGRLRRLALFSELTDEQLFDLAGSVQEELHEDGSLIYTQGSPGRDLYLVEQGEVVIQRATSYGTFQLRGIPAGELLGEVGYLTGADRPNDAVATGPALLLRLDGGELDRLLGQTPELAARLLWSLWHSLAGKLRASNEALRRIFADEPAVESPPTSWPAPVLPGERVEVDAQEKIQFFKEQGLSHRELMTLATFSRERRFAAGEYLFHEGDPGEELYAVVEGRALISKYIPGGGDEALAILGRGEFFGEMALIDGRPRSADARAHEGPLTVLALDGKTVRDLLSLDPAASLEFLELLCRLMTRRLAEIDDKVVSWQILDLYRQQEAPRPAAGAEG